MTVPTMKGNRTLTEEASVMATTKTTKAAGKATTKKAPAKKATTSSLSSKKVTMGTRPAAKKSAR